MGSRLNFVRVQLLHARSLGSSLDQVSLAFSSVAIQSLLFVVHAPALLSRLDIYQTYRRSTVYPSLIFSKIIFHRPWSCFYYNLPCVMIVHFVPALVAIFLLGALQLTVPWSLCYNLPAILDFRQPRLLFLSSFLTLTYLNSLVFLPLLLQRDS